MKKLGCFGGMLVFAMVFWGMVFASNVLAASPQILVGTSTANAGSSTTLSISFAPSSTIGVSSMQFDLSLPAGISFSSVSAGAAAVAAEKDVLGMDLGGGATIMISGFNNTAIGAGDIADVVLDLSAGLSPGTYTVTPLNMLFSDPDANEVSESGTAGAVIISGSVTPPSPTILSFAASTSSFVIGTSFSLSWNVTGTVSSVSLTGNNLNFSTTSVSGSKSVSPNATGTLIYTLAAVNANGTSTATTSVVVTSAAIPLISSFLASSPFIMPGGTTTLSWVTQNASSVSINNGVGAQSSTSSGSVSVSPTSTKTYVLTAVNAAGTSTAQATVTVDGTAPSVPSSITATTLSASQIRIDWATSTDAQSGVAGYSIYRNGVKLASTSLTTYTDTGLAAATTYSYYVNAFDKAGNISANSTSSQATTQSSSGGGGGGGGGGGVSSGGGAGVSAATSTQNLQALLVQLNDLIKEFNGLLVPQFQRDLALGMSGQDVKYLQIFLNINGFSVAASGSGSSGNESIYFGAKTKVALAKFQANQKLPSTGYFGTLTRKFVISKWRK